MWIRSQDKMKLVDVVEVRGCDENINIGKQSTVPLTIVIPPQINGYNSAGRCVKLGEYATKERVEQVMTEITDAIQNYRSTVNDGQGYTKPDLPVFIMPID